MLNNLLNIMTRLGDKVGFGGTLIAGAGCAACFPALGGLGAAIGLGFLSSWEPLLVGTVIPILAISVMLINILGWFSHRQWQRTALGLLGPVLILVGAISMSGYFLYPGLLVMLGVSIWDMVSARNKRCPPQAIEIQND